MFFQRKRKINFASKKYKIQRANSYQTKNPFRLKKILQDFKIFKIINIILLVGILYCLYFFIFSGFYNVTNVEIIGNEIISSDDILDMTNEYLASSRLFVLKNRNIFLFNRNGLKEKIENVVLLDNIKIEKILPNTLRITIKEKSAAFKWVTSSQEYLVDYQGIIIKRYYKSSTPRIFKLTEEEKPKEDVADKFLLVRNLSDQSVNLGDKVLLPEDIDFIFNLQEKVVVYDYIKITKISVPGNFPAYLEVETQDGWKLFFNLKDSVEAQLNRLELLIKEKIKKENLRGLDYIDLRLGESVYFKRK